MTDVGFSFDVPNDPRDIAASSPHRLAMVRAMFQIEDVPYSEGAVSTIAARLLIGEHFTDLDRWWVSSAPAETAMLGRAWADALDGTSASLVQAARHRREMQELLANDLTARMFPYRVMKGGGRACRASGHADIDGLCARTDDPFWLELPLIFNWCCFCFSIPISGIESDLKDINTYEADKPLRSRFPQGVVNTGRTWQRKRPTFLKVRGREWRTDGEE